MLSIAGSAKGEASASAPQVPLLINAVDEDLVARPRQRLVERSRVESGEHFKHLEPFGAKSKFRETPKKKNRAMIKRGERRSCRSQP
jgi:hypothetical protein